jgi:hypothetical protein
MPCPATATALSLLFAACSVSHRSSSTGTAPDTPVEAVIFEKKTGGFVREERG